MDTDYIHLLYEKIDSLIKTQITLNLDTKNEEVYDEFLTIQNEINHLYDTIVKARDRAVSQICYNQLMIKNAVKDGRRSRDMGRYIFLTINPPDDLPYQKLVNTVKNFTSLIFVKWAYYVFEQRGTESGHYPGFHTHILFERDRRPSEVEKAIYSTFTPLVPDLKKINWWSKDEEKDIVNVFSYIKGKKDDPDKLPKCNNDIQMRQDFGLLPLYTVGEPPLLVGGSPVVSKLPLKLRLK